LIGAVQRSGGSLAGLGHVPELPHHESMTTMHEVSAIEDLG